jgi:hypothetical protein
VVSVLVLATACGSGTVQPPQATPPSSGSEAAAPDDPLVAQLTGEVTDSGAMTHLQDVVMIGAQLDSVPEGQGSDENSAGPSGSAVIGRELADQLARTGVKPDLIRFVGDDEAPFIPVGGAENGDAKEKEDGGAGDGLGRPAGDARPGRTITVGRRRTGPRRSERSGTGVCGSGCRPGHRRWRGHRAVEAAQGRAPRHDSCGWN